MTAVPHIFIFVAVGAVVVYLASAFRNDYGPPSNRPITKNHAAAIAHYFMYYNFGRIHKSLRVTPAMEAGIADHVWSLEEIAALVSEPEAKPRGPYKKRK